jgi:hypothetical protein
MDKRAEKRHKRQVARAKAKVKLSEPDLRTPEQIKAAREASRPDTARGAKLDVRNTARSMRNRPAMATGSAAKTDG